MKNLLENDFTTAYSNSDNAHIARVRRFQGEQSQGDPKACGTCGPFFKDHGCDNQMFRIRSASQINLIDIETFLNGFKGLDGSRCDLLLYDDTKIVMADMYCGDKAYLNPHYTDGKLVIGKKSRVRSQIESTLDILCRVPRIDRYIADKSRKIALMAYRDKYEGHFEKTPAKIKASQKAFNKPTNEQAKRKLITPISHGFSYITLRYPAVYDWDND